MSAVEQYREDDFLFIFSAQDMQEGFSSGWPEGVVLVVRRSQEEDSFFLLSEDRLNSEIHALSGGRNMPVFPAAPGMPTARITYAEENEIVQQVARRTDLLQEALKFQRQIVGDEARLGGDDDFSDITAETVGPVSGAGATGAATDSAEEDRKAKLSEGDRVAPVMRMLDGFSKGARTCLVFNGHRAYLSISEDLVHRLSNQRYVLMFDSSFRRMAVLPQSRAHDISGVESYLVMTPVQTNSPHMHFAIQDSPDVLEGGPRGLFARQRGEVDITLVEAVDDTMVFDISCLYEKATSGRMLNLNKLNLVLVMAIFLGMGGFLLHSLNQSLDLRYEAKKHDQMAAPDLDSSEYMNSLIRRLFPDQ